MPKISVIIPLYNKANYITKTIQSVLAQNETDFELIIIDDGSTDESVKKVKSIADHRLRLIQQQNGGVSAARNRGIEEARAELIAFLDADDVWEKDFLQTILRLRANYPEAGIYSTAYRYLQQGNSQDAKYFGIPNRNWEGLLDNYYYSCLTTLSPPVWTSAAVVPKNVLNEVGGFEVGVRRGEDRDLWGRIAFKYKVAFSTQICSNYFVETENSIILNEEANVDWPFVDKALRAIDDGMVKGVDAEYLKEYLALRQIRLIPNLLLRNKVDIARDILSQYGYTKIFRGLWRKYYFVINTPLRYIYNYLIQLKKRMKNL